MCQVTTPHVTITEYQSINHQDSTDAQTISQQFKWFVTNTLGQLCIFQYFSGFLNKEDMFGYICKEKS